MEILGTKLKYNLKALVCYERMGGKELTDLTAVLVMLYSCYIGGGGEHTFTEVVDELDEHPEVTSEFTRWIAVESEKADYFGTYSDTKKKG